MPWRTIDGEDVAPDGPSATGSPAQGRFRPSRLLDLVRHFVVFETDGAVTAKKIAGYHQFHAARKAVEATLKASSP
jgi:type I restriction enzyme R subunit